MSSAINQHFYLNDSIPNQQKKSVHLAAKELFNTTETKWITEIFKPEINIKYIDSLAKEIRLGCKNLVIIGTGASSNIPKILFSLVTYNKDFQIHFLEDADTFKFENLISKLNPTSTRFLTISKSGRTLEILALVSLCSKWIKKNIPNAKLDEIFYFITDPQGSNNYLLQIAKKFNAKIINHPKLNGRFSFFSSLGLLPATIIGFNIEQILKHTNWCINTIFQESSWMLEAATYFITMSKKYHNAVLMTYSNAFYGIAVYLRQLISESLGKEGLGVNPIIFEGNIDQHSQLQSYLEGLPDKFFTILIPNTHLNNHNHEKIIHTEIPELTYLKNKTLCDINKLQIKSVTDLLKKGKKNLRIIEVKNFNETFIAEIITCFMLETILYAKLNNINPFTQTAIESLKNTITKVVI